ncbi:phosphotransferase [Streptomyces sp. NPDC048623]|uniref:phosphotransferase enzyme family protein n=1 Tax=Streptomyces sp. NPDC048623 TaxID=3155761 RepID=UPI003442E11A
MGILKKPYQPEYFNFDESLLAQLAHEYGVSRSLRLCPILLDGDYCTLVDVRSATSKKMILEADGRWLFLKQMPWYCDDATVEFAVDWQNALSAASFSVPGILRTAEGRQILRSGGARLMLFEYVRGARYQARPEEYRAAAATLATLHSLPGPDEGPRSDAFQDAVEHARLACESLPGAPALSEAMDEAEAVLRSWEMQAARLGWEELPRRAVHGDYSPWNLVFSETGEVMAVLDFDNAHMGPVIRDVMEAVLTFCCVRYASDSTTFSADIPDPLPQARAQEMLASYESVRSLSARERECAAFAAGAVALEIVCLGLIRGDYEPGSAGRLLAWAKGVQEDVQHLLSRTAGGTR